ncbi:ATP SYNTHASE A CHAIN [Mycoplasmopsis pulmonis]|uniref:ATP SYNTHASE A CHAIN n=1 Tax=Mycoplasmopsis pulmonis (strain UAB CTIP) TaxID=272635 RepID=Q98QT9_MYCPU|nr:F0F1 ATP synthase subunit A [Mycoplasmopsis pulmonis]CAC13445.1 ATP SYNTHASE A CHAIN [Mycoplasmopsis pulmonis]
MKMFLSAQSEPKNKNPSFTTSLWSWEHPQLFSLFITTLIIIIISLVVYFKVRKQNYKEVPKGVVLIAEEYVGAFQSTFDDASENKLKRSGAYFFSLITFLLIGNLISLIGLEPIVTSYSVPLTLALISWIGITVFKFANRKVKIIFDIINPLDLIGHFIPLLSLSVRIFGNIIGGSTVVFLFYTFLGYLWGQISGSQNQLLVLAPFFTPLFHLYFDLFGAIIQAYVFTLLSIVYWSSEIDEKELRKKQSKFNFSKKIFSFSQLKRKQNKI